MSPRNLKKVLDNLRPVQVNRIEEMGFRNFHKNFDFHYTPSSLGMWVVKSFDPTTCTLRMEDGRKIKITRELIHNILGIPMGNIKVQYLKEKNVSDEVTAKWRKIVQEIVNAYNKISISKLETYLGTLLECDCEFEIGFLTLFFSIFRQGNKDGTINERTIPYLANTIGAPTLKTELKEILRHNLLKVTNLVMDTDNKLKISLSLYSHDEELKKLLEDRNDLFVVRDKEFEKRDGNKMMEMIQNMQMLGKWISMMKQMYTNVAMWKKMIKAKRFIIQLHTLLSQNEGKSSAEYHDTQYKEKPDLDANEQKGLAADAPTSSNTSKITLIRNSDGHFDVKKNDKSDAAKKATTYVLNIKSDASKKSKENVIVTKPIVKKVMAASVPVAPNVGATAVASPARVLELDTHSSSEADATAVEVVVDKDV
ncbi:hypothetical protein Tco_0200118 [Tanacetum coccineum]